MSSWAGRRTKNWPEHSLVDWPRRSGLGEIPHCCLQAPGWRGCLDLLSQARSALNYQKLANDPVIWMKGWRWPLVLTGLWRLRRTGLPETPTGPARHDFRWTGLRWRWFWWRFPTRCFVSGGEGLAAFIAARLPCDRIDGDDGWDLSWRRWWCPFDLRRLSRRWWFWPWVQVQ